MIPRHDLLQAGLRDGLPLSEALAVAARADLWLANDLGSREVLQGEHLALPEPQKNPKALETKAPAASLKQRHTGPKAKRRFETKRPLDPENVWALSDDHGALTEKRTLFPTTVVDVAESPVLLVSGVNSSKLGSHVTKGPWAGYPIFMLTLEERATCPESCHHWATCYGNAMPRARRHKHGSHLEGHLAGELSSLQKEHPVGFVVRLHQLGDFYSVEYVERWLNWLTEFPALHVFGYTAWPDDSEIGSAISLVRDTHWDRFAIRASGAESKPGGATTIWRKPEGPKVEEGIVCPAQTGRTECCGTCGLCWHPSAKEETIVFVAHGAKGRGKRKQAEPAAPRIGRELPELPDPALRVLEAIKALGPRVGNGKLSARSQVPAGSLYHRFDQLSQRGLLRVTGVGGDRRLTVVEQEPQAAEPEDTGPDDLEPSDPPSNGAVQEGCHWPIGDPQDPDFHYCGEPRSSKRDSYCEQHKTQAHEKPRHRNIEGLAQVVT